ncbi:MAG: HAD-IC family P-type ATPase, partial [Bdellovibrionales bacterium]|nr:HAD-IC family P-type ATPase [Bdellovibrionales bacterium]
LLDLTSMQPATEAAGLGVYREDCALGSLKFIKTRIENTPKDLDFIYSILSSDGLTTVLLEKDRVLLAAFALGDSTKLGVQSLLDHLLSKGDQIGMLSGDSQNVVDHTVSSIGSKFIFAKGELSPEEKADEIRRSRIHGATCFVGDGANDALALATADIGIAMHGGIEAALKSADIFLSSPDIESLKHTIEGSRRTIALVRFNLVWSLLYNTVGACAAIFGYISPLVAAILMPLSSLFVISTTLVYRPFKSQIK